MRGATFGGLTLLALACTNAGGRSQGGAAPPSASVPSAEPRTSAGPSPERPDQEQRRFFEAVRSFDYREAKRLHANLSPEARRQPLVRLAWARSAMALGEAKAALEALKDLEKPLPSLGPTLATWRAQAALGAGKFEAAAAFFEKKQDPESLQKAARARLQLGQPKKARVLVDRALSLLGKQDKTLGQQADLRALRIKAAEQAKNDNLVALDLRWLALEAPAEPASQGADQKLESKTKRALSKHERYERAMALARAGKSKAAIAELDLVKKAPGPAIREAELLHARAWALYYVRDYAEAAKLLDSAISAGTKFKIKDTFYAARALSRAQEDRKAIERYEQLLKRYPGSGYSEEALHNIGRLWYVIGDWAKAAAAYNRYLTRYRRGGKFLETARYELAVARLGQKDFGKADTGFTRLLQAETDRELGARYRELLGVARLGANKKKEAKADLSRVIEEAPLSFPALAAKSRLESMGEKPPRIMPVAPQSKPKEPLSVALPEKVELLVKAGLDQDAESMLEQQENVLKTLHRPREYESLCQAYSSLTTAARRYRVGQQAARWSVLVKPPTETSRWLWDCVYPRPYEGIVDRVEKEFDLPPHLIHSVMRQESTFLPTVVSPANAVGLMQLIEPTARRVGEALDIEYQPELLRIPSYNIRFGGYYLRRVLDTFGQRVALAAAAYNAGPDAVSRWLESGEELGLDVFVARIPYRETRTYVYRVIGNLARYGYLDKGEEGVFDLELRIEKGLRSGADAY